MEEKCLCPSCGYPFTDSKAARCPRCNHVLQAIPNCPGECRQCAKKQTKTRQKKSKGRA